MSCVQLFAVPAVPVPDERSWQSHAVVDLAYRVSGDSPDARGMIGARCRTGRLRSSRPSGYAANAQSGTAAHTTGRRSASRRALVKVDRAQADAMPNLRPCRLGACRERRRRKPRGQMPPPEPTVSPPWRLPVCGVYVARP